MKKFILWGWLIGAPEKLNLLGLSKKQIEDVIKAADTNIKDLEERKQKAISRGALIGLTTGGEIGKLEDELNKKILERESLYILLGRAAEKIIDQEREALRIQKEKLDVHEAYLKKVEEMDKAQRRSFQEAFKESPFANMPKAAFDAEAPDAGLKRLQTQEKALQNAVIMMREMGIEESQILTTEQERKEVQAEINRLLGKQVDDTKEGLVAYHSMTSAMSSIRSGLAGIGIETGGWLDTLISVGQTLTGILELMQAIQALTTLAGLATLGPLGSFENPVMMPIFNAPGRRDEITPQMRKQAARIINETQRLGIRG